MEVEVVVPIEDMALIGTVPDEPPQDPTQQPERISIWPSIHPRLLELVQGHRSTIVFTNARRLAERLASRLNELAGEELVAAHHGSIAREQRLDIEDRLKRGVLKGIVATSSLELGIDMGAVDLVVQVESPGSVARGLQRIGRAGHHVGEPSRGKVFPKYRGDLLEATVVVRRMLNGQIEETLYPRNPLDVLAQQIVAMCAVDEWTVDDLARVVRHAANFADLSDELLRNVLDLLSGRYPSDEFAELRPRIVWDRRSDVLRAREGAGRIAIASGGTIPDRGLFGVFTVDGRRVGELDEEMVYESRRGEVFLLGATAWRIEDITFERVVVSPAPGEPGKMPFWKGDKPGRPLELGRALGATTRELAAAPHRRAVERLRTEFALDELAAENLVAYLEDQREAAGAIPDDRTIVVERFRDELGDYRVCLLTPFGAKVHAPWAMAIEARLEEAYGLDVQVLWSDDGIVIRLPESEERIPVEDLVVDPEDVEELVLRRLPATALFTSMFREAASRALLLPRRRPGQRTPLWQQRQRGRELLGAEDLRELIDPNALADLELELQHLAEGRRARNGDDVHDLLRRLGDLSIDEISLRSNDNPSAWIDGLEREGRAVRLHVAGEERFVAVEDAARYRDALGAALPVGVPAVFTEPVAAPLESLVARYARTHGPFHARDAAGRLGATEERVRRALGQLESEGRVAFGEFRPGGLEREWVDVDVLRSLLRRSLASLRREVEPVDAATLARFLPRWHSVARPRSGPTALVDTIDQLQGAAIHASTLETDVLPSRAQGYRSSDLDALCASGELVWTGAGGVGADDGRVMLAFRDRLRLLAPPPPDERPSGDIQERLRAHLGTHGASFWPELLRASEEPDERAVLSALWDLVWAGEVTNDTLAPLRAFLGRGSKRSRGSGRPRPGALRRAGPPAA